MSSVTPAAGPIHLGMDTTIVFLEVSIPRWISPAGGVTLDMTAGSLPP